MSIKLFRKFPTKEIPEPARSFIVDNAKAIDCDECMIALPLLSVIAGCVGSAIRVHVKNNYFVPAVIWTCLVGKSGCAKSPAQKQSINLIREIESELEIRALTTNATIEGLCDKLQDNPKGMIFYADELASWVGGFGRYSNGSSIDEWLSIYDGEKLSHDRKVSKSLLVRFPNVCVTGGIQPGRLEDVFKKEHADSGLMARLLFASPPHRKQNWNENDIEQELLDSMQSRLSTLLLLRPNYDEPNWKPYLIRLSSDARRMYASFHERHQDDVAANDGALNAALSKLGQMPFRLALALSAFKYPESILDRLIEDSEMESAIVLTDWFVHEAMRMYLRHEMTPEDRQLEKVLELVQNNPGLSSYELKRKSHQFNKMLSDDFSLLLQQLIARNLIKSDKCETPGRVKITYFPIEQESDNSAA